MKSLKKLCKPRTEIFQPESNDDVQDILSLVDGNVDPKNFFSVNFRTQGMAVLFKTAFERFQGRSRQSLIKLTQSMGGGKTHNMISLGLLAQHPEFRSKIIGEDYKEKSLGKVDVIAFSGRESNDILWQTFAKQLGKEKEFETFYSGSPKAPGQSAWINLLQGTPKLILLDELPPYLDYGKSIPVAQSNLSVITTTALANLFNALNKPELSNVLVVISDLTATYQSGSQLLQSTFKELEGEINRFALDIEPVGSSSDEIYEILKTRIFEKLPSSDNVNEIALAYKEEIEKAKQMGYTNYSSDKIFTGIKDAYPFHPSLRELYERFKENQNFQQTRDLIRLMRSIVADIYSNGKAEKQFLINPFDIDLNESSLHTFITQIKPSLSNAISHDIANKGRAVAEIVDAETRDTIMQALSKLLLVSSLADVPNALLGLSRSEMVGYLASPERDLTKLKTSIDEFISQAWYLHVDKDGKLYFQNVRNLVAELNSLVDGYDDDSAKLEVRKFLEKRFKPTAKDCYQNVLVFPGIEEIKISEDSNSLVLFEPNTRSSGLHVELQKLYDDTQYKNRIMFLSGERDTMTNLLKVAKEHKAIHRVIGRMRDERVRENDPQFEAAVDREHKTIFRFLSAARETFVKLYYPTALKGNDIISNADFIMDFSGNDFNGEEQIRKVLLEKRKFITAEDTTKDSFRNKCEDRLFTQKEMRWQDVKNRAAVYPSWQWHHPKALDDLLDESLKKKFWRSNGGYIEKPPFEKEKTSVKIHELNKVKETGEVFLQINPKYGDTVYWEANEPPTTASSKVSDFSSFRTEEMKLFFLCVDSKSEYETGDVTTWENKIWIGSHFYDAGGKKMMEINASNNADIFYTTDGSDPKENGVPYAGDFVVPAGTSFVVAIAEKQGIYSDKLPIPVPKEPGSLVLDKQKVLFFTKSNRFNTSDSNETFTELGIFKKHGASFKGITINLEGTYNEGTKWAMLNFDEGIDLKPEQIEEQIDFTRRTVFEEGDFNASLQIETIKFGSGEKFEDWVAEKKMKLNDIKQSEIKQ